MKKLILHIGRHKSGTSSIQRFLFKNAKELEKFGFNYPIDCIQGGYGHHSFAKKLQKKFHIENDLKESIAMLGKDIDEFLGFMKHDKINIVSSEAFQNCNPLLIRECFKDFDTNVCFYLRNELDYVVSSYLQKVHATDYKESINTFASQFHGDYERFLKDWGTAFERVGVGVFDRELLLNGDVVDDFISTFLSKDMLGALPKGDEDANPSLTYLPYKLKIYLNSHWHFEAKEHRQLYKILGEMSAVDCKNDGEKFALPQSVIDTITSNGSLSTKEWQMEVFGRKVFQYDRVGRCNSEYSAGKIREAVSQLEATWGFKLEEKGSIRERG